MEGPSNSGTYSSSSSGTPRSRINVEESRESAPGLAGDQHGRVSRNELLHTVSEDVNPDNNAGKESGHVRKKESRQPRLKLCRVPYCDINVAELKRFNKRYRICQEHRNAHSVIINGQRQRFCQMCARFHTLDKFDGIKKSCREKMYEHNRRRRSYVMKETPEEAKSNINAEAQIEESNKLLFNNLDDSLLDERQILRPGNSEGSHFFHSEKGMVGSTKSEFPTGQYNSDRIRGFDLKWRGIDIKCSGENVSLGKQAEPLKPSVGQVSSAPFQQNLKRDKSRLSAPNYLGDAQHRTNESSDRLKYSISILKDKPNPEMLFGSSSSGVDLNFQRISLKLFGCNPENLAPMVYKELNELIQRFPGQVEEYVRPGCIHLILDVCAPELWGWTVIQSFAQMTASIFKNHLTMEDHFLLSDGHKYWKSTIQNLQKGLCHFEGNNCQPLLSSISPSCIILSKRRTCFSLKMSNVNENIKVYFRQSGKVFDCLILERKEDTILFEMQTNKALKIGRAEIEVEDDNTGILSNSLPVIIAPNNALGNYVSKELKNPLISSHLTSLLRESGYILQWADSSSNKCFTTDLMLHLIHRCANDASSLGYFGLSKLIQNCRKSILHSTVK